MKTAYVASNGCQGAQAQASAYAQRLGAEGLLLADKPEHADYIVLNLCGFTREAGDESIRLVGAINSIKKPEARVVVTGCVVGIQRKRMETELPDVEYMSNDQLRQLAGNVEDRDGHVAIPQYTTNDGNTLVLKIEDGCGGKCTFCAIPQGIGRRYSYPITAVTDRIATFVEGKKSPIVQLVGEDIGFYGLDRHDRTNVVALFEEIYKLPGDFKVKADVFNPWWFLRFPELADTIAKGVEKERVVPYFGLPLQSGSDNILRKMKRAYTAQQYTDIVAQLHSKIPKLELATDVIVGFPGETEDDFKQTFNLIEKMPFSQYGVWGYTDRPGIEAASFGDKVDPVTIKKRMEMVVGLIMLKEQSRHGTASLEGLCKKLKEKSKMLPITTNDPALFRG